MDQWIKDLWNKNKLVFILLLPIVLIVFFKDLIFSYLVKSSNDKVDKTKAKDEELKQKAKAANEQADKAKQEADKLEKEIKDIEGDEDWHRKR